MTNEKRYGSLEVPLWHKWLLDLEEADAYFGIGQSNLKQYPMMLAVLLLFSTEGKDSLRESCWNSSCIG